MTRDEFILDAIGKPYQRGARGPDAYDCFGLVVDYYHRVLDLDLAGIQELDERVSFPDQWETLEDYTTYKANLLINYTEVIDYPEENGLVLMSMGKSDVIDHIGIFFQGDKILNTGRRHGVFTARLSALQRAGVVRGYGRINRTAVVTLSPAANERGQRGQECRNK